VTAGVGGPAGRVVWACAWAAPTSPEAAIATDEATRAWRRLIFMATSYDEVTRDGW
jgi:hypothetical protein